MQADANCYISRHQTAGNAVQCTLCVNPLSREAERHVCRTGGPLNFTSRSVPCDPTSRASALSTTANCGNCSARAECLRYVGGRPNSGYRGSAATGGWHTSDVMHVMPHYNQRCTYIRYNACNTPVHPAAAYIRGSTRRRDVRQSECPALSDGTSH